MGRKPKLTSEIYTSAFLDDLTTACAMAKVVVTPEALEIVIAVTEALHKLDKTNSRGDFSLRDAVEITTKIRKKYELKEKRKAKTKHSTNET
jgi:hypothetical protein